MYTFALTENQLDKFLPRHPLYICCSCTKVHTELCLVLTISVQILAVKTDSEGQKQSFH